MKHISDAQQASPRTYLFVPGDRPERFDSAWASSADAVIIDLEDAVAPDRKDFAREAATKWLSASKPVWLRINAAETPWFMNDLRVLNDGVAGVMLPKAEEIPAELVDLAKARRLPLMPIVETAIGIHRSEHLAATHGVTRLAFGSIDFQADMGIEGDDDALLYFRSRLVLASRLASLLPPVDGVTVAISDPEQLRYDTHRARRLGFGAKLCIHPKQIDLVHEVISPNDAERAWAERVISAMNASDGGAVSVDGRMVDRPVLLRALRIAAALKANEQMDR